MNKLKKIDMRSINEKDLPLIVFSDNTSGLIEFIIKYRTKGAYNHVMWANKKGKFASQGNTYSEVDVSRYMKDGNRLKFVNILGITPYQRSLIIESIDNKLARPWYKKMYDWLGIFGQAIGLNKINIPGLNYCSEDAPQHLKNAYFAFGFPMRAIIKNMPDHMSPQEFNEYLKKYPEIFAVYGYWDSDLQGTINKEGKDD